MLRIREGNFFRGHFGFGVNAQWIHCIRFDVVACPSVENQISGKENKRDLSAKFREQRGDFHVQLTRQIRLFLTRCALTQSRAMNDDLRHFLFEPLLNGREIQQIQIASGETKNLKTWRKARRGLNQIITD